jgi:hypothetical protein
VTSRERDLKCEGKIKILRSELGAFGGIVRLVTEAEFRKIALNLPETVEKSHVGHPDFRVKGGKIFATLGYPDEGCGVLILTADQQGELIGRYPEMFEPVKGAWGKRGSTQVILKAVRPGVIESAMQMAWRNAAPAKLKRQRKRVGKTKV